MKVEAYIVYTLSGMHGIIRIDKLDDAVITPLQTIDYKKKQSLKQAMRRIANKLNLELDWKKDSYAVHGQEEA